MKRVTLSLILVASLLLAGVVLANGSPTIDWDIIGSGGGYAQAGAYTLDATIGQAVVGMSADTGCELCAGFWCRAAATYGIYLPLVLRCE
jgi:hypothetical protein